MTRNNSTFHQRQNWSCHTLNSRIITAIIAVAFLNWLHLPECYLYRFVEQESTAIKWWLAHRRLHCC